MKLKYSIKLLLFLIFCSLGHVAIGQNASSDDQTLEAAAEQTKNDNTTTTVLTENGTKKAIPTTNILHQNGRINLVVFVLAIIFVGIILYLIRIERTLNKVEKK